LVPPLEVFHMWLGTNSHHSPAPNVPLVRALTLLPWGSLELLSLPVSPIPTLTGDPGRLMLHFPPSQPYRSVCPRYLTRDPGLQAGRTCTLAGNFGYPSSQNHQPARLCCPSRAPGLQSRRARVSVHAESAGVHAGGGDARSEWQRAPGVGVYAGCGGACRGCE